MPRHRHFITGALVALALAVATPGAALALTTTADGPGSVAVEIPVIAGAAEVWIDVEHPSLHAGNTAIGIGGAAAPVRPTPLGVTAIIEARPHPALVTVSATVAAAPDIAVTVVDDDGAVLFENHVRVTLAPPGATPDPTTSPPPTTTDPPAATDPPGDDGPGRLGSSGAEPPLLLLLGAALAVVIGGTTAMALRKRRA